MAYVPVPKDLSKVKTKSSVQPYPNGRLYVLRRLSCSACRFLSAQRQHRHKPCVYGYDCRHAALFMLAMYEKHGQPLEVVVKNIIQTKFIAPKERPYRTDNFYSVLERQRKLEKEVSAIAKGNTKKQRGGKKPRKG